MQHLQLSVNVSDTLTLDAGWWEETMEETSSGKPLPCRLIHLDTLQLHQENGKLALFPLDQHKHFMLTSHIPQFRERKNRIVNTQGQADEEPADEVVAAPKPGFANVNQCGYARDQCLQSIGKSSAWSGGWSVC